MPWYRRIFRPGGTYFFTLVTENRAPIFSNSRARSLLHDAFHECRSRRPFELEAIVLLPDHLHAIIELPESDHDYPTRVAAIKAHFTRSFLSWGGQEQARSSSRVAGRRRGVWQRKFWEHTIEDQEDFNRHVDYIHYNPVKHGLAKCPHAWPYSSFKKWVAASAYEPDWQCICEAETVKAPDFSSVSCSEFDF